MENLVQELAIAGLVLAAAILVGLVVGRLLTGIVARLSSRTSSTLDDVFVCAAIFPLRWAILVAGLELALR